MSIQNDVISPGVFEELGLETLPDLYDYAVSMFGPSVLLRKHHPWGYQSITYQEFGKLTSFIGAGLVEAGLDKGDRVILIAENSPEWILVYAAVTSCGADDSPARTADEGERDPSPHDPLRGDIRRRVAEGLLRVDRADESRRHQAGHNRRRGYPSRDTDARPRDGHRQGQDQQRRRDILQGQVRDPPGDIAAICYTSGTTGTPKGTVLLQRNLMSDLESLHSGVFIAPDDVFLSILPLYHTFASMVNFLVPVFRGATVAFARSIKPRIIIEDVQREEVTIVVGVPLLFEHIAPLFAGSAPAAGKKKGLVSKIKGWFGKLLGRGGSAPSASGASAGLKIRFCISGAAGLRRDVEKH